MKHYPLILGCTLLCACTLQPSAPDVPTPSSSSSSESSSSSLSYQASTSSQSSANSSQSSSTQSIARSVEIDVPFMIQAPFADWGDPYQEACEEASLIMVEKFLKGERLNSEIADKAILDMVAWEEKNGYGQDVTIQELATIAQEYYGLKTRVMENPTVEDLKAELSAGNPVIVPAAGRELHNPYFSGEGPFYHMLVLTGYNNWYFITNDPGTKRGEGYTYEFDVIMNAMHNWTGVKEETYLGERVVLVVSL